MSEVVFLNTRTSDFVKVPESTVRRAAKLVKTQKGEQVRHMLTEVATGLGLVKYISSRDYYGCDYPIAAVTRTP